MPKSLGASFLMLVLAACASVGPDYRPPENSAATTPAATGAFQSAGPGVDGSAPLPERWWRLYNDPRLDGLVEQALSANTDLRVAQANLAQAESVLREAEARGTISTSVDGGASLARLAGTNRSLPGSVAYDFGLNASYPLDLNGRIRRAIEASSADIAATAAARDFVRMSVAAATARAYTQVCSANYLLGVNRRVVALQRDTADATQRLFKGGRGTAFDVSRAETAVRTSEAALPVFEGRRQSALYLLATLLGRAPADYPREAEGCTALPSLSRPLPVGDGAALIRRRPDIRQAERTIAGDTARIGVATADLYPDIAIGGSVGLTGPLGDLGDTSAFRFSLGPLLSWSFPNRSVARARIAQADAAVQADLAAFDGTVIEALRQTETALETYRRDIETAAALTRASQSASLSEGQARRLFRFGRGDFLSLLDAQRSYARAEAESASAQTQLLDDQISIFLSLGGGWE
ncbi:outer membrane efflux protein [Sphingomonas sp. DBB INV C78]|uniref:efflux transporter outer membrane subunit n=1 Tax=Sphingomonas sp. DBB INV C78 TaxID=3349434 RepID=UPI0036D38D06